MLHLLIALSLIHHHPVVAACTAAVEVSVLTFIYVRVRIDKAAMRNASAGHRNSAS
jgi:hypothetical protein